MTIIFEIDRLFQRRPHFIRTSIMYRFIWLWFGITVLRNYTFPKLVMNKHVWKIDDHEYSDYKEVAEAYFKKWGQRL